MYAFKIIDGTKAGLCEPEGKVEMNIELKTCETGETDTGNPAAGVEVEMEVEMLIANISVSIYRIAFCPPAIFDRKFRVVIRCPLCVCASVCAGRNL